MRNLDDYELTADQLKYVDKLRKLINQAPSKGLVLLAKQWSLNAYRKESFEEDVYLPLNNGGVCGERIPYGFAGNLHDSGADDEEYFKKGIFDN